MCGGRDYGDTPQSKGPVKTLPLGDRSYDQICIGQRWAVFWWSNTITNSKHAKTNIARYKFCCFVGAPHFNGNIFVSSCWRSRFDRRLLKNILPTYCSRKAPGSKIDHTRNAVQSDQPRIWSHHRAVFHHRLSLPLWISGRTHSGELNLVCVCIKRYWNDTVESVSSRFS